MIGAPELPEVVDCACPAEVEQVGAPELPEVVDCACISHGSFSTSICSRRSPALPPHVRLLSRGSFSTSIYSLPTSIYSLFTPQTHVYLLL